MTMSQDFHFLSHTINIFKKEILFLSYAGKMEFYIALAGYKEKNNDNNNNDNRNKENNKVSEW